MLLTKSLTLIDVSIQYNVSLVLIILFQWNNLESKNAVVKPLASRTFPGFTIPKKRNLESIRSSKFFGILADECTDISNKELLSNKKPLHRTGNGHVFSDVPGNFVVFVELLLHHHIICDTTGKVARKVWEIGPSRCFSYFVSWMLGSKFKVRRWLITSGCTDVWTYAYV